MCGKVVIVTYIIYCFAIEDMITSCRAVPRQEGEKEKQACKGSKERKKGSWPHSPVLRLQLLAISMDCSLRGVGPQLPELCSPRCNN